MNLSWSGYFTPQSGPSVNKPEVHLRISLIAFVLAPGPDSKTDSTHLILGRVQILLLLLGTNCQTQARCKSPIAYLRGPSIPNPVSALVETSVEEVREEVQENVHHGDRYEHAVSAFICTCLVNNATAALASSGTYKGATEKRSQMSARWPHCNTSDEYETHLIVVSIDIRLQRIGISGQGAATGNLSKYSRQ